ncbi:hypothetical protein B0H15DRAFT_570688 [Mycena belliarum]|uniref:Secreted protein n=1 Tax=Mycena belliarum TaxID=1033014 RepID=A0AAD6TVL2_9AGAR|nr:hypothetical protein B0H15DRAFT_570688 [Mycena belliae]
MNRWARLPQHSFSLFLILEAQSIDLLKSRAPRLRCGRTCSSASILLDLAAVKVISRLESLGTKTVFQNFNTQCTLRRTQCIRMYAQGWWLSLG